MGKETDENPTSIPEWIWLLLRKNALSNGDKIALVFADDGTSKTYQELLNESVYVAAGLKEMGLKQGDILCIVTRNTPALFPVALGCLFSGIVVAPLSPVLTSHELGRNISLVQPKVVLTRTDNKATVENAVHEAGSQLDQKPKIYVLSDFYEEAISRGSKCDVQQFRPIFADFKTHPSIISFSSGTTGPQKPILVRGYKENSDDCDSGVVYQGEKCKGPFLSATQIFWATWWIFIIKTFVKNRTEIFVDKADNESILSAIQKYRPESFYTSPTDIIALQKFLEKNPGKWDLSSLQLIVSLGAVLQSSLHKFLQEKLKIPIYQKYGTTETGQVFRTDLSAPPVFGSIGKPVMTIKIVDVETREEITEPNKRGELLVKDVSVEYLNNPEATRNAYDEYGWYKTGDIFYFTEDGHYRVCGRVKDIFKFRDQWVIPSEIEEYIQQVPGVAETVVVGKKVDDVFGYVPVAFVVREPNSKVTEQDIKDFLAKENIQDSHKLRGGVIFVESLPRNSNYKILRQKLQDLL